jgi:hypothetical protein
VHQDFDPMASNFCIDLFVDQSSAIQDTKSQKKEDCTHDKQSQQQKKH